MTVSEAIALAVSILLLAYLTVAVVAPERF